MSAADWSHATTPPVLVLSPPPTPAGVRANHFKMSLRATQAFHYDVAIDRLLSEEEVAKQAARKERRGGESGAGRVQGGRVRVRGRSKLDVVCCGVVRQLMRAPLRGHAHTHSRKFTAATWSNIATFARGWFCVTKRVLCSCACVLCGLPANEAATHSPPVLVLHTAHTHD